MLLSERRRPGPNGRILIFTYARQSGLFPSRTSNLDFFGATCQEDADVQLLSQDRYNNPDAAMYTTFPMTLGHNSADAPSAPHPHTEPTGGSNPSGRGKGNAPQGRTRCFPTPDPPASTKRRRVVSFDDEDGGRGGVDGSRSGGDDVKKEAKNQQSLSSSPSPQTKFVDDDEKEGGVILITAESLGVLIVNRNSSPPNGICGKKNQRNKFVGCVKDVFPYTHQLHRTNSACMCLQHLRTFMDHEAKKHNPEVLAMMDLVAVTWDVNTTTLRGQTESCKRAAQICAYSGISMSTLARHLSLFFTNDEKKIKGTLYKQLSEYDKRKYTKHGRVKKDYHLELQQEEKAQFDRLVAEAAAKRVDVDAKKTAEKKKQQEKKKAKRSSKNVAPISVMELLPVADVKGEARRLKRVARLEKAAAEAAELAKRTKQEKLAKIATAKRTKQEKLAKIAKGIKIERGKADPDAIAITDLYNQCRKEKMTSTDILEKLEALCFGSEA